MSLDRFNSVFIQDPDTAAVKPYTVLPIDPSENPSDTRLKSELLRLHQVNPDQYAILAAAVALERLQVGTYNKGSALYPRRVTQVKANTTSRHTLELLRTFIPDLPDPKNYNNVPANHATQYTLVTAAQDNVDNLLEQLASSRKLITTYLTNTTCTNETLIEILSGFLIAERGAVRVVRPSRSDPNGDIRVQFDIRHTDELLERTLGLLSERLNLDMQNSNPVLDDRTRNIITGEKAHKLLCAMLSTCPIIGTIRPEIYPVIAFGLSINNLSPNEIFNAYREIIGSTWRGEA